MSRTTKHHIQSLDRGLTVLLAFTPEKPHLTLTKLAQATDMNKSVVQRLTDTLVALSSLGRNQHKEFYLGPKLPSLGYTCLQGHELREVAREQLRAFSRLHQLHRQPHHAQRKLTHGPLLAGGGDLLQFRRAPRFPPARPT